MVGSECKKEMGDASFRVRKIIISTKIKEFRQRSHLTQAQFADLFGVTAQCVSKWEQERSYPDITLLPLLADAMGCPIDEFFD